MLFSLIVIVSGCEQPKENIKSSEKITVLNKTELSRTIVPIDTLVDGRFLYCLGGFSLPFNGLLESDTTVGPDFSVLSLSSTKFQFGIYFGRHPNYPESIKLRTRTSHSMNSYVDEISFTNDRFSEKIEVAVSDGLNEDSTRNYVLQSMNFEVYRFPNKYLFVQRSIKETGDLDIGVIFDSEISKTKLHIFASDVNQEVAKKLIDSLSELELCETCNN